jgi:hypothetical protein
MCDEIGNDHAYETSVGNFAHPFAVIVRLHDGWKSFLVILFKEPCDVLGCFCGHGIEEVGEGDRIM